MGIKRIKKKKELLTYSHKHTHTQSDAKKNSRRGKKIKTYYLTKIYIYIYQLYHYCAYNQITGDWMPIVRRMHNMKSHGGI